MQEEISFGVWLRKERRALDLSRQSFASQVACVEVTLRRIEAILQTMDCVPVDLRGLVSALMSEGALLFHRRFHALIPINKRFFYFPV